MGAAQALPVWGACLWLIATIFIYIVTLKMKPFAIVLVVSAVLLLVVLSLSARAVHCHFGRALPLPRAKTHAARYMWPAKVHSNAHAAAARVAESLEAAGIEFWPMCGTLIGAMRHGGVIPWDNDVDFGVWEHDADRLKAAILAHKDASKISMLRPLLPGLKIGIMQIEYSDLEKVHVDVVSMHRVGDDIVQSSSILRHMYPKDGFKASELLPLKHSALPFGPTLRLPGPHNAHAATERIAPGYMTKAVVSCNHAAYMSPVGSWFLRKRTFNWPL